MYQYVYQPTDYASPNPPYYQAGTNGGHHYASNGAGGGGGGPLDFIWYLKEDVNEFLSHW